MIIKVCYQYQRFSESKSPSTPFMWFVWDGNQPKMYQKRGAGK